MVRRRARVAKEVKVAAARWQSCGSGKKPLQLRGHALLHPDAQGGTGARCALRHDQKFVSRTPASVGLHDFHFPQRRADELAEIVRQSTGRSTGRIAAGTPLCDSNWFGARPRAAAGVAAARQSVARWREHAARKFFPRARRVQRIPSPGAGCEGIGLSSRSLIARRYRRTLAVEFAAHYIY